MAVGTDLLERTVCRFERNWGTRARVYFPTSPQPLKIQTNAEQKAGFGINGSKAPWKTVVRNPP